MHVSPYIYRGPTNIAIWEEREPGTRDLIAIKHRISTFDQERTIYMDGRPHPPVYAAHTWMGFSTGQWQGNMLVVTTTHIKKGWLRRNGVPESDLATLTEYFVRNGDVMTRISAIADPVYLTEPLVKSEEFVLNTQGVPHPRVAVQVQAGGRGDPARGRRAALPAGHEHVRRGIPQALQLPGIRHPRRRRADLSGGFRAHRSGSGDEGPGRSRRRRPAK